MSYKGIQREFYTPKEIESITGVTRGLVHKAKHAGIKHRYDSRGLVVSLPEFNKFIKEHNHTRAASYKSQENLEKQLRESYEAGVDLIHKHHIQFDLDKPLTVKELSKKLWDAQLFNTQAAAVILALGFLYLDEPKTTTEI